jgi:acyl-coenzyme A synthetase/AMP-(fatty) acid ligase
MLKDGFQKTDELKEEIIGYCKNQLISYSRPRIIEFIDDMPMTQVGKVSFRKLEEMERNKIAD